MKLDRKDSSERPISRHSVSEFLIPIKSLNTIPPNHSDDSFCRDKLKQQPSEVVQNYSSQNKKSKRKPGEGSGYIKTIERAKKGKRYTEYWYQWEIWLNGKQVKSGTTYIPQKKLSRCRAMDASKETVNKILRYLRTNRKKKK